MASMLIRNIPDDVLARFKAHAEREGKSTEQLARETLAEKAIPDRSDLIRRIDAIRNTSLPTSGQEIIDEIRRDREGYLGRSVFDTTHDS